MTSDEQPESPIFRKRYVVVSDLVLVAAATWFVSEGIRGGWFLLAATVLWTVKDLVRIPQWATLLVGVAATGCGIAFIVAALGH